MADPAIVTVYDELTKWFAAHDIEVETQLGWRAAEKRLTQPRLVFEPGDRDVYGEFSTETPVLAAEWGQIWTCLTIYVQSPAPADDERAAIVNTTKLLHAVLVALQQTVGLVNFRVLGTRWLLEVNRRANAAVTLTISVRDVIDSEVSEQISFDADGRLIVKLRDTVVDQPVPAV
jgi:hypothetical protein